MPPQEQNNNNDETMVATTETTTTKDEQQEQHDEQQDEEPTFRSAKEELTSFDKITYKGQDNGLFQRCMTAIRSAHFQSNKFRAILIVAGLFTDKLMYRQVLSLFYIVTKAMEEKLQQLQESGDGDGDDKDAKICQKILSTLPYRFTKGYEQDLQYLYSNDDNNNEKDNSTTSFWKEQVQQTLQENPKAVEYLQHVQSMKTESELAGAVFVLWGALIIGGGAAAKPKIQHRFGSNAVHLFDSVTGPGREERKRQFVQLWDSLIDGNGNDNVDNVANNETNETNKQQQDEQQERIATIIVESTKTCMQYNNDILCSLNRNPWWYGYIVQSGIVLGTSILMYQIQKRYYS